MNTPNGAPPALWRTLRELEDENGAGEAPPGEFPEGASEWQAGFDRRGFLKLMGASLALGTAACTRLPTEEIVPYVRQPEFLSPGEALYFATVMPLGGEGIGLLVRSHEGRPTKIEGNPDHPANLGRSSVSMQAELLNLYDPGRSKSVTRNGRPEPWENLLAELSAQTAQWRSQNGAGVHLLTRRIASPTLREQVARFLAKYPAAKWHEHDPAFPRSPLPSKASLDKAEVILSLDADFLGTGAASVRLATEFARARKRKEGAGRLYAVESMPGLAGAMADHRLPLSPGRILEFAQRLTAALNGGLQNDPWLNALVRDLERNHGRSIVLAGDFQPAAVHEAARAANEILGNIGHTIDYFSEEFSQPQPDTLMSLADALHSGAVNALFILGGNPAYDAPADLAFGEALTKARFTFHMGLYADETAAHCQWHAPESHFLEAWSDARAFDGSLSIAQPVMEPLYASHSPHELLAALLEEIPTTGYEIVREAWKNRSGATDFESYWRKALHDGMAPPPERPATVAATTSGPALQKSPDLKSSPTTAGFEIVIRPDPHVLDGRFAENAWLQELPKPFTRITWENAAHLSRRTAAHLGLEHGDVTEIRYRGRSVRAPIWIMPGHADQCVTVHLGYGRTHLPDAATPSGFNAFAIQTEDAPWGGPGLEIRKTGDKRVFATTQEHQSMEGRNPIHIETFGKPANRAQEETAPTPDETLYPAVEYGRPAWGMVIDLNSCIGCGVCTIACQAENNIPVVGREQVLRGREMHWIRVDRYFEGDPDSPRTLHQPIPCMHCEKAPCEVVCPVAATVHDHEGLNVMVYNRCVGTRYCSNNCPYKVRRFNFLQFTDNKAPTLKMMRNPDVTVRMRGVMEKCTYCAQRISAGRIAAEKESRPIRDGEVTPACAQACPADAITFGDIHDPKSRVAALRTEPRHYALLAELNTRPRTTYLARVYNPNPELA